jgi:iron complex transport system substrate-binding protein
MSTIFSSIRQIAAATHVQPRGEALIAGLESRLKAMRRAAEGKTRPRVLFIIGRRPGALADLVAVGPDSYLNELIEIAGGANVLAIAGQPQYPRISMETVLRMDPDIIIDTVDMGDTDAERRERQPINERLWTAYGMLSAVKTRHVYAATTDALVVPGPRVVDAAEWIADLIHRGR